MRPFDVLPPPTLRDQFVGVKFSMPEIDLMEELCGLKGLSRSDLIRLAMQRLVKAELGKHFPGPDAPRANAAQPKPPRPRKRMGRPPKPRA